jgi:hypothetical protein
LELTRIIWNPPALIFRSWNYEGQVSYSPFTEQVRSSDWLLFIFITCEFFRALRILRHLLPRFRPRSHPFKSLSVQHSECMLTSCSVAVWWLALLLFLRKVTRFKTRPSRCLSVVFFVVPDRSCNFERVTCRNNVSVYLS